MARQLKRDELTLKDMSVIREGDQTKVQRDRRRANIRDYSLNHRIELQWDLNEEAERDQMCRLIVDDIEMIIDAEEVMRYLRWV